MEYKVRILWCPDPQAYAGWLHHSGGGGGGGGGEPENKITGKMEATREPEKTSKRAVTETSRTEPETEGGKRC
jgi:hypothetical protein